MALQKYKDDGYGGGGISYWRVIETNVSWMDKRSHIVLAGYVSEEARRDDKKPVECQLFDWQGEEFPFDIKDMKKKGLNIVARAYEEIKRSKIEKCPVPKEDGQGVDYVDEETNWFADAKDV